MRSSAALLNQFALAVDNVEDGVCDRQLLTAYFMDQAEALHFEVLMDGIRVEGQHGQTPGLQTKWTSGDTRSIPIFWRMASIGADGVRISSEYQAVGHVRGRPPTHYRPMSLRVAEPPGPRS